MRQELNLTCSSNTKNSIDAVEHFKSIILCLQTLIADIYHIFAVREATSNASASSLLKHSAVSPRKASDHVVSSYATLFECARKSMLDQVLVEYFHTISYHRNIRCTCVELAGLMAQCRVAVDAYYVDTFNTSAHTGSTHTTRKASYKVASKQLKLAFEEWLNKGRMIATLSDTFRKWLLCNSSTNTSGMKSNIACDKQYSSQSDMLGHGSQSIAASTAMTVIKKDIQKCCVEFVSVLKSNDGAVGRDRISIFENVNDGAVGESDLWSKACVYFFGAQLQKAQNDTGVGTSAAASRPVVEGATSYIWKAIFHEPFILHLNQLLSMTTTHIISHFQYQLVDVVLGERLGVRLSLVDIESESSRPTLLLDSNTTKPTSLNMKMLSNLTGLDKSFPLKSNRIFSIATKLNKFLFEEIEQNSMLIYKYYCPHPSEFEKGIDEDRTGTESLAGSVHSDGILQEQRMILRAFQAHIEALFGCVICVVRNLSLLVKESLNSCEIPETMGVLTSVQLVLGRFTFMMSKSLSGFVAMHPELFRPSCDGSSVQGLESDLSVYIDENQLRSAFEIADANGDGCLMKSEVSEAMQALAVDDYGIDVLTTADSGMKGNSNSSFVADDSRSNFDFYHMMHGKTKNKSHVAATAAATATRWMNVSYNEFLMIFCKNLWLKSEMGAFHRMQESIAELLTVHTHFNIVDTWVNYTVGMGAGGAIEASNSNFAARLDKYLFNEFESILLRLSKSVEASPSSVVFSFKRSWGKYVFEDSTSEATSVSSFDNASQIPYPRTVSPALYDSVCRVSKYYNHGFLSYDLFVNPLAIPLESHILNQGQSQPSSLLSIVVTYLLNSYLDQILVTYNHLHTRYLSTLARIKTCNNGEGVVTEHATGNSNLMSVDKLSTICEDIALQCYYDCLFVEHFVDCVRDSCNSAMNASRFKELLNKWESCIDAVTITMLQEKMSCNSRREFQSMALLIPCTTAGMHGADGAAAEGTEGTDTIVSAVPDDDILSDVFCKGSKTIKSNFPMLTVPIATTSVGGSHSSTIGLHGSTGSVHGAAIQNESDSSTSARPSVGPSSTASMLTKAIGSFW